MITAIEAPTKAISIWQPWASLIALGHKRYETRNWRSWHRGPIAIHAARKVVAAGKLPEFEPHWGIDLDPDLPMGAIVAVANIVECCTVADLADLSEKERALGDYRRLARWAWRLDDVVMLPEPVPMVGRQGIYTIPPDLRAQVAEQMEHALGGVR